MILRSIRVRGWRCFASGAEIGEFGDGLNVVYGPNGSGKSTLLLALVRALFDAHYTTGGPIEALRPWGRDLSPRVTVEFEHNGQRFRLEKAFLSEKTARLERLENGRFEPVAEGRRADERVREMLKAEPPGRGASKLEHWGLAQVLWVPQGALQLDKLSEGAQASVREALGSQVSGESSPVEKKIAQLYEQYFTPRGQVRRGAKAPPHVQLKERLRQLEEKRQHLRRTLEELDEARRRLDDLAAEIEHARAEEAALEKTLQQLREQERRYRELESQWRLAEEKQKRLKSQFEQLQNRLEEIDRTRRELSEVLTALQRLSEDDAAVVELVEQAERRVAEAERRLSEVQRSRQQVEGRRTRAERARRFAQARQEVERLSELLAEVEKAKAELEERTQLCDKLVAPDDATLKRIERAARRRDDARLKLDTAVIQVRLTAESDLDVELLSAEKPGAHRVSRGSELPVKGAPHVELRIPGVARVLATGPTESAEQLRRELEEAERELEELTAGFGTRDLPELRRLRDEAVRRRAKREQAEERLKSLLRKGDEAHVRSELQKCRAVLEELLAAYPEWEQSPPDPDELDEQARQSEREYESALRQAREDLDRTKDERLEAQRRQQEHETRRQLAEQQRRTLTDRLEQLCPEGQSEEELKQQRSELALQFAAAEAEAGKARETLEGFGENPARQVERLERQLEAVRQKAEQGTTQRAELVGRLGQLLQQAPYSELARVEEEIETTRRQIAQSELRMNAVRLLYETLKSHRSQVLDELLEPVQRRATRLLQRIAGPRFRGVLFNEQFVPCAATPAVTDTSVGLDELSGGEREQVYFAVRLALAELLFDGERQLLVLDDVFTYTDTPRLNRIVGVLEEAAQRFQIVLLTCHPERYHGLSDAKFFDVEACRLPAD